VSTAWLAIHLHISGAIVNLQRKKTRPENDRLYVSCQTFNSTHSLCEFADVVLSDLCELNC